MNHPEHPWTALPDVHFHPAFNNLPPWLLKASPATRDRLADADLQRPSWHALATREQWQALKNASDQHMIERTRLESRLARLQNARDFAEPLLTAALSSRFGLELDVRTTFLRLYIPQHIHWFPIASGAARTWTVSLLDAALHNFQASETRDEAYEPDSTYITEPSPTGQFDTLPAIKRQLPIQRFTQLCRELDIGARYQAYLKESLGLNNRVAGEVIKTYVIQSHKTALRAALEMAHLRKDLPEDVYRAIHEQVLQAPRADNRTLRGHSLSMMASTLTGILVFAAELQGARRALPVVAYIPDDPEAPLKHYENAQAFIGDLTRKLRSPAYQAFFSRFVDHGERGHFFADLTRRLGRVTWHQRQPGDSQPSWRNTPIDTPNLQFSVNPINAELWPHLYQQHLNKILNDARTVAVSTASADRAARWALWDALGKIASTIVEVVSFVALPFVPFLGELTLAYLAYQVLDESFEGIIDWAEGLKTQALGQLLNIAQTAVQLGVFAVGGAMAANAFSRLLPAQTVALFSSFKPVRNAGKTRYWRPDLTPYEQALELPKNARPDELGLYRHQGKTLLRLEDKLYAVKPDSHSGEFQIEHPTRAEAYQPPLQHNHHGAWQTVLDDPITWDRDTVMRRLGHSVESFSHAEREQILRISGFHDNVLREVHVEHQRPPSLLTDTIKRFRIDRDIQALIDDPARQHPDREQALHQRLSLFESRYRDSEQTSDRDIQLLQGAVRGLPTDIAGELVANATASERLDMHHGRTPRRLTDLAYKALEAVRVARAYEGFYLPDMETVDTRRLALHSLESMPGWPTRLRIEVRQYSHTGEVLDSLGEADAPDVKTLVNEQDDTFHLHEDPDRHGTFYQVLLGTLTQAERDTLGLVGEDSRALKKRIVDVATNQPRLRTLFAKHPLRKPVYDPSTMRLPGGTQGYPRRHGSAIPTLENRVLELYRGLDEEELSAVIASLRSHPDGARTELTRRASELHQLHRDLSRWINDTPVLDPETGLALSDSEQQGTRNNRRLLAQEIRRSWRRQSERDVEAGDGDFRYTLRFSEPIPGDLPLLTADFPDVSVLTLEGHRAAHGIPAFVQRFSGLRRLELRRFTLDRLPDAIANMPHLETLILSDCGIQFDGIAWKKLASMKKLKVLDLNRNAFDAVPGIESMPGLVHLDLSDTGLTALPRGATQHTGLNTLMLMNNAIDQLPPGLFDSPVHEKRGVFLSNNPLTEASREQIKLHYFQTAYDLGVSAPAADIQRVMALYPNLESAQASDFLYELPGTWADSLSELTRLEAELAQLGHDLSAWTADLPALHPVSGEPFTADQVLTEHLNRDAFMQALQRCWRQDMELDEFNELLEPTYELVLDSVIHGELPALRADFSHVSALELRSDHGATRIGRFLEAFPKLKRLKLRDFDLGNLPEAVFKMGPLNSLSLPNCRITLSAQSASALAGMEGIEYLDLAHNPLQLTPDFSQMQSLATVVMHDTGLREIPHGLLDKAALDWVDLSNNAITDVPSDILEMTTDQADVLHLSNNPFSEATLLRLIAHYEKTGIDFGIEAVIQRGEVQMATSDESEADE